MVKSYFERVARASRPAGEVFSGAWFPRAPLLALLALASCAGPEPIVLYPGRDRGLWVYVSAETSDAEEEVKAMIEANGVRLVPAPEPLPNGPRGPSGENLAPCLAARQAGAPIVVSAYTSLKADSDGKCIKKKFSLEPKQDPVCLESRTTRYSAYLETGVTVLDAATCRPLRRRIYRGRGAATTPALAISEAQRAHDFDVARRLPDLFVRAPGPAEP